MKEDFSTPPEFEVRSKALFSKASITEREFVELCLLATQLIETNWDKRQGMAYSIVGALSYENIRQDDLLDQIGAEFGVLELPDAYAGGSEEGTRKMWSEVEKLVKEADKKFPQT